MLLPSEIATAVGPGMLLPSENATAVEPGMMLPSENAAADGPVAVSDVEAAQMNPTNALLVELYQSLSALRLQLGILQNQVVTQQAQIVSLTTTDTYKDPLWQVNELKQKGLLADFTESRSHTGPPHERVHTCSWAIDGTLVER